MTRKRTLLSRYDVSNQSTAEHESGLHQVDVDRDTVCGSERIADPGIGIDQYLYLQNNENDRAWQPRQPAVGRNDIGPDVEASLDSSQFDDFLSTARLGPRDSTQSHKDSNLYLQPFQFWPSSGEDVGDVVAITALSEDVNFPFQQLPDSGSANLADVDYLGHNPATTDSLVDQADEFGTYTSQANESLVNYRAGTNTSENQAIGDYTSDQHTCSVTSEDPGDGHSLSRQSSRGSDWSLVELDVPSSGNTKDSAAHGDDLQIVDCSGSGIAEKSDNSSGDSGIGSLMSKRRQRRPFLDLQSREETSNTRKDTACLRCRMQRIRCHPDPSNPRGTCETCRAVSKQILHTLPCLRYKLTECTLYRLGAEPGLEYTFRWPTMRLKDISTWASLETRKIKISQDLCPQPFEMTVRRFVPIKEDKLERTWTDGNVRKSRPVAPYAVVNMTNAAIDLRRYIDSNVMECMDTFLKDKDLLIRETYTAARRHAQNAEVFEERALMEDLFRLWFAIRQMTRSEHIVGDDQLGMTPELNDRSYPLFGKVPIPPVMAQQLEIMLHITILAPLRKKVLNGLQKTVAANRPKSWFTIYLSQRFEYARKHGLKHRYASQNTVENLHHGANVLLAHFHYCNKGHHPFLLDWKHRQNSPLSDLVPAQVKFMSKTKRLYTEREMDIQDMRATDLFEDELYFVSQMFDKEWSPGDTI
ncbi:MAG: hypothetical protein M1820_002497 [Bogoriella megaspora]|nr:MAG: hypothetical protein M1820_002497 [Bogoriella megaspora]